MITKKNMLILGNHDYTKMKTKNKEAIKWLKKSRTPVIHNENAKELIKEH